MAVRHKRLSELVIRSENARRLVRFYQDILGLKLFASFDSATFLKIDDDFDGHPQLLAIFEKSHTFSGPKDMQADKAVANAGTLHHFAFVLEKEDFLAEQERLNGTGIELQYAEHPRFGWRSVYMFDPDGNSVELICYDASLLKPITKHP